MLAQMLILLLAFTLFSAYTKLHSQNIRRERTTLKDLVERLILALEADLPWDQWFASGERAPGDRKMYGPTVLC
ncbi:MAG TPA: hypothetical protein VK633_10465 [Verrucomicrobiae bacterium]|nr:hypothetical protein [Verrucomicrobiae bacterium]